jgi:hypothetical protein
MKNIKTKQSSLAIAAQALYLLNLLALPGLAFLILLGLFFKRQKATDQLGRCHLHQAVLLSLWGLTLLVGGGLPLWLLLQDSPAGISMTLLYIIVIHTGFVLLGIIGLAKAISGQHFHPCSKRCPYP